MLCPAHMLGYLHAIRLSVAAQSREARSRMQAGQFVEREPIYSQPVFEL
jgi:hypothetical protein